MDKSRIIPESDTAELSGAISQFSEGDVYAGLDVLHPFRHVKVACVANGDGGCIIPGRGGGS